MYKLQKNGIVRIAATEAEAVRWQDLGYQLMDKPAEETTVDPLADLDVEDLKAFAASKDIDIGGASSKNGIMKKIRAVLPLETNPGGSSLE